jgi:hypothetical protein
MIRFCAQMEIKGSRERVWDLLMKEFPPEYRHPGKVDLNAIEAAERAERERDTSQPSRLPDMEVLDWNEGQAFVVQVSYKPYLQNFIVDLGLEDTGGWEGDTIANVRLEVKAGCLLTPLVRVIYWLFRERINTLILQSLAGLRYELETGKRLERDAEFKLPLERIEKVHCK